MSCRLWLAAAILAASLLAQAPRPPGPRLEGAAAMNLVVRQVPPVYPPIALQAKVQGVVHVVVHIGVDGKLENAQVTSGSALLRQAGLDSIAQWTFRPFLQNGQPTTVIADFDVVFRLP